MTPMNTGPVMPAAPFKSTGSAMSVNDMMKLPGSFAMPAFGGSSAGVAMPGMPGATGATGLMAGTTAPGNVNFEQLMAGMPAGAREMLANRQAEKDAGVMTGDDGDDFLPTRSGPISMSLADIAGGLGGLSSMAGGMAGMPGVAGGMAGGADPTQAFKSSQAYKDFQSSFNPASGGGMMTMDMYDSPYFGQLTSGSYGRALDAAYENWLGGNRNAASNPSVGNASPAAPIGMAQDMAEDDMAPPAITDTTTTSTTTGGANTTALDPSQSTLSPNFASYIYNMLGKGEGLAALPFQEYTGQRFAGPSALQQQAFQGIGALGPSIGTQAGIGAAATALGGLQNLQPYEPTTVNLPGVTAQQISSTFEAPTGYTPTTFQSKFQAPTAYQTGTFNAPGVQADRITADYRPPSEYQSADLRSTFQTPEAYQAGEFAAQYVPGTIDAAYKPGTIESGLGALKSIQEYMSPYQQAVTDIQAREARRQADVSRTAEQARLAQAGAFGGSRQAILEAERQRNLGQQIGDITEKGLQSAYDRAMQQRLQEAGVNLEAQRAQEQARQFGANIGLESQKAQEQARQYGAGLSMEAQKAREASRQFAAQQGMTASQLAAQFNLDASKANELSRQFGYQQKMTASQLQTQFGMDAAKANQVAALQAAQATQQAALDAQRMQEQSRQFGAQQGMTAAQLSAQFGLEADKASELSRQFAQQQQMTAADLQARYGMDAAKANQVASLQAQQSMQQAALEAQRQQEASRQFGARFGLEGLQAQLGAASALGSLGGQEFQQGLQALQAQATAGEQQRKLEQEPLDFAYQQFQESMKYPYQQATFMQSLLQGLPLAARAYDPGQSSLAALLEGGLGGLSLYNLMGGKEEKKP